MKTVALEFTYHTDVMEVPDFLIRDIKKVQRKFDQWLYDKSNDHGLWVKENGRRKGVCFGSEDFVRFINEHILPEDGPKARLVCTELEQTPPGMPVLFF